MQEEVDRLTGMGDPVQEFLASEEFTSVDPRQQDEEVYTNMRSVIQRCLIER